MVRQFRHITQVVLTLFFVFALVACGGGGGGGGSALQLTGTVSDSAQAPVAGAKIAAYNANGKRIALSTTNIVGRYSFSNLPTNAPLTFKVTGPAGTFPAQAEKVSLGGTATVLDFYLPSSGAATEAVVIAQNLWESQAQIDGPRRAYLELAGAPASTPAVTLAPVDVSQFGDGFPAYSVSPLAVGVDEIVEVYAAAAFSFSGPALPAATLLWLPVPQGFDAAAAALVAPVLYRFDETTAAWVAETAVPVFAVEAPYGSFFKATVTQPGYYRVGAPVAAVPVTGILTYSDGTTPAAGVTVHATGTDYGYQQVVVTDKNGQFTALVKDGGSTTYTFTAWGFGVELSETVNGAGFTSPHILDFAAPLNSTPAAATVELKDPSILPNPAGEDSIGLIVASGRLSSDVKVIDGTMPLTPGRADVAFNVNSFDHSLTLNATTKGSGIQQAAAGKTFANLTIAPATGYSDYTTSALIPIPTTIPAGGLLVVVKTSDGYAKISIDSVTETPALSGIWEITFRSKFSLSGKF